jgi:hypothetical protein
MVNTKPHYLLLVVAMTAECRALDESKHFWTRGDIWPVEAALLTPASPASPQPTLAQKKEILNEARHWDSQILAEAYRTPAEPAASYGRGGSAPFDILEYQIPYGSATATIRQTYWVWSLTIPFSAQGQPGSPEWVSAITEEARRCLDQGASLSLQYEATFPLGSLLAVPLRGEGENLYWRTSLKAIVGPSTLTLVCLKARFRSPHVPTLESDVNKLWFSVP